MYEQMVVPVEWKAGQDGSLEGYLSTFGNVDLGGDVVMPGAFDATIQDLKANGGIPFLADHIAATSNVLGTIYDASTDEHGLKIKVRFSSAPSAQDVRTKMAEGHIRKMSMGYEAKATHNIEAPDGGVLRGLDTVDLWEGSAVVFPMNPQAEVTRVKSLFADLPDEAKTQLVAELTAPEETSSAPQAGDGTTPDNSDDSPAGQSLEKGWDRYASEAVLAGRDPNETADTATLAALRTRLELLEQFTNTKE